MVTIHGFVAILERYLRVGGRSRVFHALRAGGVILVSGISFMVLLRTYFGQGAQAIHEGRAFLTFAHLQLAILILFSGVLGSLTVSRERQGRSLEVLLASGFRPLAIVGGLALGRWIPLAAGLLSGLPIAILFLALGGTTPLGLWLIYLITFSATILTLGLGSFVSSYSPTSLRGLVAVIALLILGFVFLPAFFMFGRSPILVWISPFAMLSRAAGPYPEIGLVLQTSAAWGLTGIALCLLGVGGLRRVGARPGWRIRLPRRNKPLRPARGDHLFWLEARRGSRLLGRIIYWLCLGGLLFLLWYSLSSNAPSIFHSLGMGLIGFILWISCLAYSLTAFGNWKREGLLSSLLPTPLTGREILGTKLMVIGWRLLSLFLLFATAEIVGVLLFPESSTYEPRGLSASLLNILSSLASLTLVALLATLWSILTSSTVWTLVLTLVTYWFWLFILQVGYALVVPLTGLISQSQTNPQMIQAQLSHWAFVGAIYALVANVALSAILWMILVRYFNRMVGRCE
ncbi:MAG: hypothetical protein O7H41_09985 [Planctomycetota bacterium]|nr:hypothetical protein [Planctomycetota bacterium]